MKLTLSIGILSIFFLNACIDSNGLKRKFIEGVMPAYKPCANDAWNWMFEVREGNLESLKKLIKKYGTEYGCDGGHGMSVVTSLSQSPNYECYVYYFKSNPSQESKDFLLGNFEINQWAINHKEESNRIVRMMIKNGGRKIFSSYSDTCELLNLYVSLGYDFTAVDSDGNTDLIQLLSTVNDGYIDLGVEGLNYMVEHGVDINHKNKKGQTVFTVTRSKKMRNYLNQFLNAQKSRKEV